jgi:hypothetical protein
VAEGVVDDISHEGLRAVLREEGVTFSAGRCALVRVSDAALACAPRARFRHPLAR